MIKTCNAVQNLFILEHFEYIAMQKGISVTWDEAQPGQGHGNF